MTTPEIARLNPFDGLFLRAVHLQQIQLYAQALVHALGLAGGPGVVYGYGLALASDAGKPPHRLDVQPGLAVDGDGRVLLSQSTIGVELPGQGQTLVWRVELTEKDEPFGQESSYGDICVDPCAEGVSTAPFVGERVDVRLTPLALPAGMDPGSPAFRNRAASWYFERERLAGAPIIAASDRDASGSQGRPISANWAAPTGPAPGPVAVGLLLRTAEGFVVDVWAARRDRVQSPPETGWMSRLAMRPWQVFIAQLLQFQDQLSSAVPTTGGRTTPNAPIVTSVRADVSNQVAEAVRLLESSKVREPIDLLRNTLAVLVGEVAAATVISLPELGFEDLPPAGYLPAQPGHIYSGIPPLFPPQTGIVFNAYRADTIVELVARAQHADRIPLTQDGGGVWPPRIEIMVPVPEPYTDGHDLQTGRSWVAFRRAVHIPLYTDDPIRYNDASHAVPVAAPTTAGAATGGQSNAGSGNAAPDNAVSNNNAPDNAAPGSQGADSGSSSSPTQPVPASPSDSE